MHIEQSASKPGSLTNSIYASFASLLYPAWCKKTARCCFFLRDADTGVFQTPHSPRERARERGSVLELFLSVKVLYYVMFHVVCVPQEE